MSIKPAGRISTKVAITAVASLALILVGWAAWKFHFSENEHYTKALKYIQASDFDPAASELRLCLQDSPDYSKAKGMLAYCALRNEFDNSETPQDRSEATLLYEFNRVYTFLLLQDLLPHMRQGPGKDILDKALKLCEGDLKDQFRKSRLPFRDWVDFRASIMAAVPDIYKMKQTSDDPISDTARDISAALLASTGDKLAAKHLMDQCALDPALMSLTLVAGDGLKAQLEGELQRKDSFIQNETRSALRLLMLKPEVRSFASKHGDLRLIQKADLPDDQQDLIVDQSPAILFDDDNTLLLKLQALDGLKDEPAGIRIQSIPLTDTEYLTVINGFDGESRKNCCRVLLWDGTEYKSLKFGSEGASTLDLQEALPYGWTFHYDKDHEEIAVPINEMRAVKRNKTVNGTQTVLHYGVQPQWNPNKYTLGGSFYGGYDYVEVPYTTEEPTSHTESYSEYARGTVWRVYKIDRTEGLLTSAWSNWIEGPADDKQIFTKPSTGDKAPEVIASAQPSVQSAAQKPAEMDDADDPAQRDPATEKPTEMDDADNPAVRDDGNQAPTPEVSDADLDKLSAKELTIRRNEPFARHGLIFGRKEVADYFSHQPWYHPSTHDAKAIEKLLTPAELAYCYRIGFYQKRTGRQW
jgi:hypothetical protein